MPPRTSLWKKATWEATWQCSPLLSVAKETPWRMPMCAFCKTKVVSSHSQVSIWGKPMWWRRAVVTCEGSTSLRWRSRYWPSSKAVAIGVEKTNYWGTPVIATRGVWAQFELLELQQGGEETLKVRSRVVVLKKLIKEVFIAVHDGPASTHLGRMKTLKKMKARFLRSGLQWLSGMC